MCDEYKDDCVVSIKLTDHERLEIERMLQFPEDLNDWDRKNGELLNWYRSGAGNEPTKIYWTESGFSSNNPKYALYEKMNKEMYERMNIK